MSETVGVEEVEHLEHQARPVGEAIADLSIPQRRAARRDARVLDERTRTEVTDAEAAEERLRGSTVTPAEITRSSAPGM